MKKNSLDIFIEKTHQAWGPLSTDLVQNCQNFIRELVKDSQNEDWFLKLKERSPVTEELYRDKKHGFLLLAHTEKKDLYRPPHDHGNGWVIYTVCSGEMRMRVYNTIVRPQGQLDLVQKGSYFMKPGDSSVYLPKDIHDTKCIAEKTLMFRFTSSDFQEEQKSGRMIKYLSHADKL